jgi:hypothetical protein
MKRYPYLGLELNHTFFYTVRFYRGLFARNQEKVSNWLISFFWLGVAGITTVISGEEGRDLLHLF